ncbi:MAG: hypothetical protein ACK5G7_01210 [Erysipelotrichaceae bacterium]
MNNIRSRAIEIVIIDLIYN